jgi:hypothetical protein
MQSFIEAGDATRGALANNGLLHSEPMRNESGVLKEIRFYNGSGQGRLLHATVPTEPVRV